MTVTDDDLRTDAEREKALEARFRPRLVQELSELETLIAETEDSSAPVALDQQSVGRLARMGAMQVQAMAKETAQRRRASVLRLRRALARMAEGEFGYCSHCGEPIAIGRLEADPTYHECVGCAAPDGGGKRR